MDGAGAYETSVTNPDSLRGPATLLHGMALATTNPILMLTARADPASVPIPVEVVATSSRVIRARKHSAREMPA